MSDNKLVDMIQRHEGCKLMPYKCTAGKTTIGYGRNIEDTGISIEEADFMLTNDIECCRMDLSCKTSYFDQLDHARQSVCIDMLFNLGWPRYSQFKLMNAALKDHDYSTAAGEMLDSRWAVQVGNRAKELAEMMRTGKWQ